MRTTKPMGPRGPRAERKRTRLANARESANMTRKIFGLPPLKKPKR